MSATLANTRHQDAVLRRDWWSITRDYHARLEMVITQFILVNTPCRRMKWYTSMAPLVTAWFPAREKIERRVDICYPATGVIRWLRRGVC